MVFARGLDRILDELKQWGVADDAPEVNVNNDIPTESRMHPNGWGWWWWSEQIRSSAGVDPQGCCVARSNPIDSSRRQSIAVEQGATTTGEMTLSR